MSVPKYDELFNPLLGALFHLGGSGSILEQEEKVADLLKLSDEEIGEIHRGNRTKLSYNLAWARTYLKKYGLIDNSSKGIWSLTKKGNINPSVDKDEVKRFFKKQSLKASEDLDTFTENESIENWKDDLLTILKQMDPSEFERLCQRILREAGFIEVKVTGKSGDGGIDGRGIFKVGGFLSFRVIFQCKRYKDSVSSQLIREFKGTMDGRADKGLFITTGTFTREAKNEASRDGSVPIDLVDGEELVSKMKELNLGVKTKTEEIIEVDGEWFKNF